MPLSVSMKAFQMTILRPTGRKSCHRVSDVRRKRAALGGKFAPSGQERWVGNCVESACYPWLRDHQTLPKPCLQGGGGTSTMSCSRRSTVSAERGTQAAEGPAATSMLWMRSSRPISSATIQDNRTGSDPTQSNRPSSMPVLHFPISPNRSRKSSWPEIVSSPGLQRRERIWAPTEAWRRPAGACKSWIAMC